MIEKNNFSWYLVLEFLFLFMLLPLSLLIAYPIWIKAAIILISFAYILRQLYKMGKFSFRLAEGINWPLFLKRTGVIFLVIAIITAAYVYLKAPESLFFVPLNNPTLYFFILMVYTILSVWPQEIIYRTFFISRYEFNKYPKWILIVVNALCFSLAHIFFRNWLVMILTFLGGILFAINYLKFKSTLLVSIQHAIYGNWLFTVGMGEMLAFPGMETP